MRIAIYHNTPLGGAKRGLHGFVRELAARGHHLVEYCLSTADNGFLPLTDFIVDRQVIPFTAKEWFPWRVPVLGNHLHAAMRIATLRRLDLISRQIAHQIDAAGFDLVFAHDCMIARKPPILRHLTTPSVFYCHHSLRGSPSIYDDAERPVRSVTMKRMGLRKRFYATAWAWYWWYFSRLEWQTARSADLVLTNSYFARESYYRDFGVYPRVVPCTVDSDIFAPEGPEKENYILSVGSLNRQKAPRFLVRAVSHIPASCRPPLVLLASGGVDTPEAVTTRHLAEELGVLLHLARVTDQQTLVRYYARAQVFVFAPILEAHGLAPLEAMACGTPVVAVREGGVRETVVHGETGFLVERDEYQFADAVTRLLTDAGLRSKMGLAARAHIKQDWGWEAAGDKLEACMSEAVRKKER